MQNIKKYFMTLALLITAVSGAWAQTAFGVKEITADMLPASWSTDESAVTADDLAKLGFMEVTKDEAKTWTGVPQQGNVRLIYTVCQSVNWSNGEGGYVTSSYTRKIFYSCLDGQRIFITTELTEWSLTPDTDKKVWTFTMPANDVELQVEYYAESNLFLSKDALANKASITVTAGEDPVAFDDNGKSENTVTEGNTVTAKFTGKKVLGMTVKKKPEPLIVNPVVGQYIGSDGKNYDANATLPTGVTAVAKIAYVGNDAETSTTYNHGLALALADVSSTKTWCSQTDATCLGTGHQFDSEAGAKGDMAGIANTDALVNNTGHTHAAASAARNYNSGTHPAGTSAWFLPSAGQWNKMFTAAGGYENLKTNASLQNEDENYWSSTEYNAAGAWDFLSDGGSWNHNSKSSSYDRVRPCLAF